jgi:predicted aspartyl protease
MHFYGNRPSVEVQVNGRGPFLFLIDTGAAGPPARADASLVKRLAIAKTGATEASDASGASVAIDQVTLRSVALGSLVAKDVPALSRDYGGATYLPKIDGILGISFFKDYLLTLDFAHDRVTLADGALPRADGQTVLDYQLVEGNLAVEVELGGRRMTAIIDTGNMRAVDLPSGWLKTMRLASYPRIAGTSTSVSGSLGIREVELAKPLKIGRYMFAQPRVTFADDFGEANIGSMIWQHFIITIDQKNRRVRLIDAK